jgi:hypothetical protein
MLAKVRQLSPDFSNQIVQLFDSLAESKTMRLTELLKDFFHDEAKNINRVH